MDAQHADAKPCVAHVWRLTEVVLDLDAGAFLEYVCVHCDATLHVAPHGVHPETT